MPSKTSALAAVTTNNTADNPLVELLQKQVANAFVLYANFKHYHWQVTGPLFVVPCDPILAQIGQRMIPVAPGSGQVALPFKPQILKSGR